MGKSNLTTKQKKAEINLYIIIIVTLIALGIYSIYQNQIINFSKNKSIHIILRTMLMAFMQYSIAGFGITIVSVLRRKSFLSYGLKKKGTLQSIIFSTLIFIPYVVFLFITGKANGYLPFQSVWITKEVLASVFPVNIIGLAIILIAWGFFEGFNYVVISEKINIRYPSQNKWLNWGAITCAIMCLLVHGMIGVTPENIIEAIIVFVSIYGMLMIKEFTDNAWGCVFIFVFLWNAF
ncbi:hypothetical protein ACFIJ5_10800 [Haloimpatiens sp. FM7330]|uniref:hypothetical protein n=1 Tax=Haloimpatiens sp. FM7330 TaxID=3298610 RepID=UPI0036385A9F